MTDEPTEFALLVDVMAALLVACTFIAAKHGLCVEETVIAQREGHLE